MSSRRWLPSFIALGITWGSSFLFIKWGLASFTTVGVAFGRAAIGAATLLLFSLASRSPLPRPLHDWGHLGVMAFLLNALPSFLFAYAEQYVTSVMAGLLNATTPLMTVLVIALGFREQRITRNQFAGVLIGFVGIVLVTGALTGLGRNAWQGIGALLVATLCYGVSFPYAKRHVSGLGYSATTLATTQVLLAALMLAPFVAVSGLRAGPLTADAVVGMLLLGSLGTGIAYIWNFRNVALAGSAVASTVTYITPAVAAVLGIALLGEDFHPSQAIGGLLVLLSAALVQERLRILRT